MEDGGPAGDAFTGGREVGGGTDRDHWTWSGWAEISNSPGAWKLPPGSGRADSAPWMEKRKTTGNTAPAQSAGLRRVRAIAAWIDGANSLSALLNTAWG